jgi:protein SCO1/2
MSQIHIKFIFLLVLGVSFFSCNKKKSLPILGERKAEKKVVEGKSKTDTLYHTIPTFSFTDQFGKIASNQDYLGKKIYVADFFFTSCPTICPKMKTQMLKLYKHFEGNNEVSFLSHTIDPRHDTVPVLSEFAKKLGVKGDQWRFVTGKKEQIYDVCLKGYMTTAKEDSAADGGFIHSGAFILVDKQQRVRGIYDGTNAAEVEKLQDDIDLLLLEYK